jgi:L,D-transpeptidase ErfK/SrfK
MKGTENMKSKWSSAGAITVVCAIITGAACELQPPNPERNTNSAPSPSAAAKPDPSAPRLKSATGWAVTLPVLDAFLADESFVGELKSRLELTDDRIARLRKISREATGKLREEGRENDGTHKGAAGLSEKTESHIKDVIGYDKTLQLLNLVAERWGGNSATAPPTSTAGSVPADTRIVVNDPAFRMDVFENGQLIKSYLIGIGYPEFPLPTGLRQADTIIFNPTWTPPDEPWVEAPGSKVEVGKTVNAGDKLNPLGLLKIPIGLPSLIHGGKAPSKLGNFASHGCVGLTDAQAKDFAKLLARLGRVQLDDEQISAFEKNKTETKAIKLSNSVPVELRYDTIIVEDGKLHIYRDVYERDTNTEQNLRAVLEANGVRLDQLTKEQRAQVMRALELMSRDVSGTINPPDRNNGNANRAAKTRTARDSRVTRDIKGDKEAVIQIDSLKGKGYPAPMALDTGQPKPKKSSKTTVRKK